VASAFTTPTLTFMEVAKSCLFHHHRSKAFTGRNLPFFSRCYQSWC